MNFFAVVSTLFLLFFTNLTNVGFDSRFFLILLETFDFDLLYSSIDCCNFFSIDVLCFISFLISAIVL